MRFDGNYGGQVNYQPNSFNGPVDDKQFKEPPLKIYGDADRYDHREGNDDYKQPGDLFRLMTADKKELLIGNIVRAMKPVPKDIQLRQLVHFYKADPAYGIGVGKGLGIAEDEIKKSIK